MAMGNEPSPRARSASVFHGLFTRQAIPWLDALGVEQRRTGAGPGRSRGPAGNEEEMAAAEDAHLEITWLGDSPDESWWIGQLEQMFNVTITLDGTARFDGERERIIVAAGEFPDTGAPCCLNTLTLYEDQVIRSLPEDMLRTHAPDYARAMDERYPDLDDLRGAGHGRRADGDGRHRRELDGVGVPPVHPQGLAGRAGRGAAGLRRDQAPRPGTRHPLLRERRADPGLAGEPAGRLPRRRSGRQRQERHDPVRRAGLALQLVAVGGDPGRAGRAGTWTATTTSTASCTSPTSARASGSSRSWWRAGGTWG